MLNTSQVIIRWVAGTAAAMVLTAAGATAIRAQADPNQTPPSGQARPPRPGPGGGRGFGGPFGGGSLDGPLMPRVPDLTDAQRDQMKAIADRHQADIRPLMDTLGEAQMALEDAIVANPSDEATVRLKSADVASAEADLAVARAQVYAEVVALLTPEQQQRLQEQREQMKQRRANGPPARRR